MWRDHLRTAPNCEHQQMNQRSPLDPSDVGDGFAVRVALARGIPRARLRAQDLASPFWGTRQFRTNDTLLSRCRALMSRMPETAAISHSTSALLWGIPLPSRLASGPVHVTVATGHRAPEHSGASGHQRPLAAQDVAEQFGFRMTVPERTWCDLAEQTSLPELIAAGDFLLSWRQPLTALEALADYSARHVSRRGATRRRDALPLLSARAESYSESILRALLMGAGFPVPEVNHNVYDGAGRFIARVDLAWPEFGIALEYEGDQHRTDRRQWQRDLRRVEELQDARWRVVRVSADDLHAPVSLFARLTRLMQLPRR
jgi:hypothetical protein